ncbi:hypothetical protein [Psychrobacter sp. DAB_AL32B]|uniref:hypothetical protein n=1 Tax=Psychrobacter sp. DAB_AL32B TaxID=1028414 RepID=UPI000B7EB145|nr:hypothetical protein [Psychrobacter sp. DAB_AL32B]OXL17270.1 hypothetical protein CAN34_13620 [Psychrobacter sp. DAB_AL32B]
MKKLLILLLSIFSFSSTANAEQKLVDSQEQKYRLYFSIINIDTGPIELRERLPIEGMIFNKLEHDDGSEYYLATLKEPFQSEERQITYIIIGARNLGQHVGPKMDGLPVNIAYVIDDSLLNQKNMDFNKGKFSAIGFVTDISNGTFKSSN